MPAYSPPFRMTDSITARVIEIGELVGVVSVSPDPRLCRGVRRHIRQIRQEGAFAPGEEFPLHRPGQHTGIGIAVHKNNGLLPRCLGKGAVRLYMEFTSRRCR